MDDLAKREEDLPPQLRLPTHAPPIHRSVRAVQKQNRLALGVALGLSILLVAVIALLFGLAVGSRNAARLAEEESNAAPESEPALSVSQPPPLLAPHERAEAYRKQFGIKQADGVGLSGASVETLARLLKAGRQPTPIMVFGSDPQIPEGGIIQWEDDSTVDDVRMLARRFVYVGRDGKPLAASWSMDFLGESEDKSSFMALAITLEVGTLLTELYACDEYERRRAWLLDAWKQDGERTGYFGGDIWIASRYGDMLTITVEEIP